MSPTENRRAMESAMAKTPEIKCAIIMLRGTATAAFLTSSPISVLVSATLTNPWLKGLNILIWVVPSIPNALLVIKSFEIERQKITGEPLTHKRPCRRHYAYYPGYTVTAPSARVFKVGEDKFGSALWR